MNKNRKSKSVIQNAGVVTSLLGVNLFLTKTSEAGGDSGGGSESGNTDYTDTGTASGDMVNGSQTTDQNTFSKTYSEAGYDVTNNNGYSVAKDADGNTVATWNGTTSSTPFLLTWDGAKFVHENDFLFGKPQTAFADYKTGLKKYQAGIGGDIYLLNNEVKADENGLLKFEIRELEPEESYIDKFELSVVDLNPSEHLVVDGDLEHSYIFDINEAIVAKEQKLHHYHNKQNIFTKEENAYNTLIPQAGKSLTLESKDELIIRVPVASLNKDEDAFILVDSHFRDWSLGNQVPFSALERFSIGSIALGKNFVGVVAGASLVVAGLVAAKDTDHSLLAKMINVPYTYAEVPTSSGTRSLVVSVGDGFNQTYLQTLFPRYVQASQEAVRIPKEIIQSLKDEFLTVRILATKKHKVRSAFVFQGTPKTPEFKKLDLVAATHIRENKNYNTSLNAKNMNFLHTMPGDRVEVAMQDLPKVEGKTRRYALTANGFYTRLSKEAAKVVGKDWLSRLDSDDRNLLKNLRIYKS